MSNATKIDFVAPPFAGHLFPLLELGRFLREQGYASLRVASTEDAAEAIRLSGLTPIALLPGRAHEVWAIANTQSRTGFHPLRLYRQFRQNMALMGDVAEQLRQMWSEHRPDLVIADFTIPVAGLVARSMGIPWWTSMPTPCALETKTGTPSYLGGWTPNASLAARARDALGRGVITLFKRGVAMMFRPQLRTLGLRGLYREDGTEAAYSDERILGIGMREFEFERDWPKALQFVGPLTEEPPFPHTAPDFTDDRPAILVTLGTHLPWARERAAALIEQVAAQMPDCVFHLAMGKPGSNVREIRGNVHHYGFIPYDRYLPRYRAAIMHGGTGITYACIKAGVPMLVWPHDYDQYDHAARIVERGLGIRLKPRCDEVVRDLRTLLSDERVQARVREFQQLSTRYHAGRTVIAAMESRL
ncbi:MAG TPA: glycosyltransferase [Thermoanaerobaculia bacterium]|nr:glycosyltransferase [Thermoanaerobaculia bacterium]